MVRALSRIISARQKMSTTDDGLTYHVCFVLYWVACERWNACVTAKANHALCAAAEGFLKPRPAHGQLL